MKFRHVACAAAAVLVSVPALATSQSPPACGAGDLAGVSFISCAGYFTGNLISGNASAKLAVDGFLSGLGLSGTGGSWIEKIDGLNGSHSINFATPLNGVTFLGIHMGGTGSGVQGTAFYKIDAGFNLDILNYTLNGSSNAALYAVTAVPEPASYAMLLAGLVGIAGFVRRRRRA